MSIFLFFIVLVGLVVFHELGHFFAAKVAKMKVLEFGVGFPPKIAGKRFSPEGTEYTLNWIPFGGFVRIFGEDPKDALAPGSFTSKPALAQACVLFAGPFANIVLAIFLYFFAFLLGTPTVLESSDTALTATDTRVVVAEVLPDSPASLAGLRAGDEVVSVQVENETFLINTPEDVARVVSEYYPQPLLLTFIRQGEMQSTEVNAVTGLIDEEPERAALGVATALVGTVSYPPHQAFIKGIEKTIQSFGFITVSLGSLLASVFTFSADVSQIAGPVGIASLTGEAAAFGVGSLLSFAALLSINLGIINLLPFPALDGGRLLFLGIETVSRKKIPLSVAGTLNTFGFVLLILLMVAVTIGDISRLLT